MNFELWKGLALLTVGIAIIAMLFEYLMDSIVNEGIEYKAGEFITTCINYDNDGTCKVYKLERLKND